MKYDIFISYKRKSLPTANNLYYRLTTRGYSTFFDLEEMRRDNFNVQLLNYIENAKDVFVLLEEGSLDACKHDNWEEDWFCKEILHAIKTKRNIIPILIGDYKMPKQEFFPKELQELSLKNAPEFSFSYFDEYLNKLIEKRYITSEAEIKNQATSIFKFYSNENCQVFKEGKLVCSLEGMADEPYYLPVSRKGDYRFKVVNESTNEYHIINENISGSDEKIIEITWKKSRRYRFFSYKKGCSITMSVSFVLILLLIIVYNMAKVPSNLDIANIIECCNGEECTYVNLGLPSGTLWSDRNLGANNKYDDGSLYEWGGITPITLQPLQTKENYNNIIGTPYDAASVTLGDKWCLPSEKQMNELIANCKWEWQNENGGYLVIGPNGNSIFLPAAGCVLSNTIKYRGEFGYYWTGDSHPRNPSFAQELLIGIGQINIESGRKNVGRSIRAVYLGK